MNRNEIYTAGVVLAIGAVLLVLAFAVLDDGGRQYSEIGYEDYIAAQEEVVGTNGPLEVVNIDGESYIHATGLGRGAVVYSDRTEYLQVVKSEAVMILMNGQSNAAYYHPDVSTATTPNRGDGFYFGFPDRMPSGTLEDVTGCEWYDFVGEDGLSRVGDRGPGFAKEFSELTGKKTLWVSLGIPGRLISDWIPNRGVAWLQDERIVSAMLPKIPEGFDVTSTWMAWSQGESDYELNTGYDHYVGVWKLMHDSSFGVDVDGWILLKGRTVTCGWVNEAFQQLIREVEGVEMCTEIADTFEVRNGLMEADDLHYSQLGENALGSAMARFMASRLGHQLTTRAPIYLTETIERCDIGDAVDLQDWTSAEDTDGNRIRILTSWEDSTPDTAAAGIVTVTGTPDAAAPPILDGTPTIATVYVGYIGFQDGLELMHNSSGGMTVIGRDSMTLGQTIAIPDGVTEIAQYALHWGPWTSLTVPDSVTTLGYRAIQSTPLLQTMQMSDSLTSVTGSSISVTLYKDGEQVTGWYSNPSRLAGLWEWDGTTAGILYYREAEP